MIGREKGVFMENILRQIEHVEHLSPECLMCAFNKYSRRHPEGISPARKVEYIQRVMSLLAEAPLYKAIPVIVRDIDQLRIEMFGFTDDYTEIKKHFNQVLMEQEDKFRARIARAEDPLMLALQLALVGNYIDFGMTDHIDEDFLNQLLQEAAEKNLDQQTYESLKRDLARGGRLVFLTDNCGEIVMDKLLMEVIKEIYPDLSVFVVVRGMNTMNDATMEDARQIGLTEMKEIDQVVGNGNNIMGTWFPEVGREAADLIQSADLLIAKGQANFETMRLCGLNIYYLFLCKCDYFGRKNKVKKMSGMLINDRDPRNRKE